MPQHRPLILFILYTTHRLEFVTRFLRLFYQIIKKSIYIADIMLNIVNIVFRLVVMRLLTHHLLCLLSTEHLHLDIVTQFRLHYRCLQKLH